MNWQSAEEFPAKLSTKSEAELIFIGNIVIIFLQLVISIIIYINLDIFDNFNDIYNIIYFKILYF